MELVFTAIFTHWYGSRYYHWPGQMPFPLMVAVILGREFAVPVLRSSANVSYHSKSRSAWPLRRSYCAIVPARSGKPSSALPNIVRDGGAAFETGFIPGASFTAVWDGTKLHNL